EVGIFSAPSPAEACAGLAGQPWALGGGGIRPALLCGQIWGLGGHSFRRFLICWQQNLSLSRARKNSSAWSIPSSTHSRSTRSFCALTSSFHVFGLGASGLAGRHFFVMRPQTPALFQVSCKAH